MMNELQIDLAASNAIDFYRLAKRGSYPGMIAIGTPSVVCAAFSAELAMKSILYKEGTTNRGHKLLHLMMQLPRDVKDEIESKLSRDFPDYKEQLSNCDTAFVDWRYVHEVGHELNINIRFALLFAEICCSVAMKQLNIETNIPLEDIV